MKTLTKYIQEAISPQHTLELQGILSTKLFWVVWNLVVK
jgi:hypothetical protein